MRILTIILLISTTVVYSQTDKRDLADNIQRSTDKYKMLFLKENFIELSDYASPKLISYLKSKQDFEFLLAALTDEIKSKGVTVKDLTFGTPTKILEMEGELQSTIPFTLKLEDETKFVIFHAGLALISYDKGENWYFTFKIDKDNLKNKKILGLHESIVIDTRTQEIIPK